MTISARDTQRILDQLITAHIRADRDAGRLTGWTPSREEDHPRSYTAVFADDIHRDTPPIIRSLRYPVDVGGLDDLIEYARAYQWWARLQDRSLIYLFNGDITPSIAADLDSALSAVHDLDPAGDADYLASGDQSQLATYTIINAWLTSSQWSLDYVTLSTDLDPAQVLGRLYRSSREEFRPIAILRGRHPAIMSHWLLLQSASPNKVVLSRSLYVSTLAGAGDARRITTAASEGEDREYLN